MIKIGNLDIDKLYLGTSDNVKVYLGDVKLYPSEQPSFQGKWLATYTAGTTSSAECDSTSAITSGEITLADLETVIIGDCVTSIGNSVFSGCTSLTSCTIGSGVTSIGGWAFRRCSNLTSIDIPSSVTSIGHVAFGLCTSLTSCTIPNSVTSIGYGAFTSCDSLTSINIPSGVTSIGNYTFDNCSSLTSIDIPSGVTSIGSYAFLVCTGLTSIDIPSGVTSIGESAFQYSSRLTSITVNAVTPPTLGNNAFNNTNDCPIYVPSASVEAYKTSWSTYASRIQAIPSPYQWVTFTNGDTISSDLQIYGIKGIVNDLSKVFGYSDDIYVENAGRNKYNVIIGGFTTACYSEYDILSNTSVEYTFSDIGCSDSYTVSSKTIADMSNDIQLLIYVIDYD